jgi:membrane protease YdiL (CAAX protease family)
MRSARAAVREHPLPTFFGLAIALSWSYWVPDALTGGHWSHFPGLLGPAVAAILTSAIAGGDAPARLRRAITRVRVAPRWYAAALLPLAVAAGVLAVRGIDGRLSRMDGLPDLGWFGVAAAVLLVNGFGEETGWRGFAWPRLRERRPLPTAALWLTIPWAIWHAPLFWIDSGMRGFPALAVPGFVFSLGCGAVVLGWLYDRSASVAVVALWHTMLNMATATHGTEAAAPVVSVFVIAWAVWMLRTEQREVVGHVGTIARHHPAGA